MGEGKSSMDSRFRWSSKCTSTTITRTASRDILFSLARIKKTNNDSQQSIIQRNDNREGAEQFDDVYDAQYLVDNSGLN